MTYDAIMQRRRRAKVRAAKSLQLAGYAIIETMGEPFDIIAVKDNEARFIRIVIGRPNAEDIKRCRALSMPINCIRETCSVDDTGKFEFKHIL